MRKASIVFLAFLAIAFCAHSKKFQDRIFGGSKAVSEQFPYQVSVQKLNNHVHYEHFCGGSIIGPRYVLTAAHCITTNKLRIRAGILHLDDSSTVGQTISVHRAFVHPDYNDDYGDVASNDIAVLRLEKNLTFSDAIQPVSLPLSNLIATGVANLTGWGHANGYRNVYSNNLMFAEVHIISLDDCKQDFIDTIGTYGPLDNTNICTQDDSKFACQGDSGGPLVQDNTVVGVASFSSTPCDITGVPTAYSNVSIFVDWINEQLQVQ